MDEPLTRAGALALVTVLIIPLVNLFKNGGLPDRLAPTAALALGLLGTFSVIYAFPNPPHVALVALTGLATGLSAAGLYSGARATVHP